MEALALKSINKRPPLEEGDTTSPTDYAQLLEFASLPLPQIVRPKDVLIQVMYSDVNPVDLQKLQAAVIKTSKDADVRLYASQDDGSADMPFITGYGGTGMVIATGDDGAFRHLVGKPVVFLADPNRPGSYASHIVTDGRCLAELPHHVNPRDAACVPVAGLTAYESLAKVGLASNILLQQQKQQSTDAATSNPNSTTTKLQKVGATVTSQASSLLVVGGSGGVGSWCIALAKAFHPHLAIAATSSSSQGQAWCQQLGATKVLGHDEIARQFTGGPKGSVQAIICLTEPTPALWNTLTEIIQPYGTICLVVSGASIKSLDLSFCFFKGVTVTTQTVFNSLRTGFEIIRPAEELQLLVQLLANQTIRAPLSPLLDSKQAVSEKFKDILDKDKGMLHILSNRSATNYFCGKLVLCINSGMDLFFVDLKTASLIKIPRLDCIEAKIVTQKKSKTGEDEGWKDAAKPGPERDNLISLIKNHPTLGIAVAIEKTTDDFHELELQESEQVKNLWGVSLKKRERNQKGQEFIGVDPRSGVFIELSRKDMVERKIITPIMTEEGQETLQENVTDPSDRDDIIQQIRKVIQ